MDLCDQSFISHRGDYPLTVLGKKDGTSGIDRADGPRRRAEARVKVSGCWARQRATYLVLRDFCEWAPLIVYTCRSGTESGVCMYMRVFVVKIYQGKVVT